MKAPVSTGVFYYIAVHSIWASYNGSMPVSKTGHAGSNPAAYADFIFELKGISPRFLPGAYCLYKVYPYIVDFLYSYRIIAIAGRLSVP